MLVAAAGLFMLPMFPFSPCQFQPIHRPNSTPLRKLPIVRVAGFTRSRPTTGDPEMGKGNNSRKNDKKSMKPKQEKPKPAAKK
jgi:hypothetical protein